MSLFGSSGRKPDDSSEAGSDVRKRTVEPPPSTETQESRSKPPQSERRESSRGGSQMASLGKSIVFKGDLSGDEDLEIEGRVEGTVALPGHQVTIGANGKVTAQVEAKSVVVIGHVSGNVSAGERVEVQASGIVDGDIVAPRLLIQEGAVVNGSIQMGAAAKSAAAPPKAPAEPERKTG